MLGGILIWPVSGERGSVGALRPECAEARAVEVNPAVIDVLHQIDADVGHAERQKPFRPPGFASILKTDQSVMEGVPDASVSSSRHRFRVCAATYAEPAEHGFGAGFEIEQWKASLSL
jgi:hypothetical protein